MDAKRYLCAASAGYIAKLSPASMITLAIQGGPMNAQEMSHFRQEKAHRFALKVRIYDDLGKKPKMERPELEHYIPNLRACLNRMMVA